MKNKQLDDLIEEAVIDCYDEYEYHIGFNSCLENNLIFPFQAEVIGERVTVTGLFFDNKQIKAVCEKQSKKYTINILDVEYNPKIVQNYQWIETYKRWIEGN
jgi:hypothetical protein